MFVTKQPPLQFSFHGDAASSPYRPTISSPLSSSPIRTSSSPPLSPLDGNALPRFRGTQSSPIKGSSTTTPGPFKYANRNPRPNPVVQKRDDARDSRRKLFLSNVRQRANDKRWEMRGGEDELGRLEWTRTNRELEHARGTYVERLNLELQQVLDSSLDPFGSDALEVERHPYQSQLALDQTEGMGTDFDERMIDTLEQEEAAEIDSFLPSLPAGSSAQTEPVEDVHFSDDDVYDSIFNDFVYEDDAQMNLSQDVEML